MLFIITFLAINEKKINPNGQCYGDYRIDKTIPFPFIRPTKACIFLRHPIGKWPQTI